MKYSLFLYAALLSCTMGCSQTKKDQKSATVQTAIEQKSYVFHAQTVLPANGRSRQLTSPYSFTVRRDSVISDLPYFGRAYSAPLDPTKSALQFNSVKFNYTINDRKKGGWDISIQFKDVREVQQVSMTISKDGSGTLQVIPTNRQTISFNGTLSGE